MERYAAFTARRGEHTLTLELAPVGGDWAAILRGGEREHIGSAVLAVPRPGLSDPEKTGSTSSVLNVCGHKDEAICRRVAERICESAGAVVTCTGGFHTDGLTPEGIGAVTDMCEELAAKAADYVLARKGENK